jgi:hypothetical protein
MEIETKILLTPEFDELLVKSKGRMSKRQFATTLVEKALTKINKRK